jgi:hypothetical protein
MTPAAWIPLAAILTAAATATAACLLSGHTKTPAQASPPAPGTTPPTPPGPPTGLPPRDGLYGRCVMTVFFFHTGITVTYDHTRMRRIIDTPPVEEWGGLEAWLREPHDFDGPPL